MSTPLSKCKVFTDLADQVEALSTECVEFCPVVVGETKGVDSPINLNPAAPTAVTWGGWQSQDETVVATSGNDLTIASDDVCVAHVTASVTAISDSAGATGNAQRAHPELWLLRDGQRVALAQIYVRDANGQDSDTWVISWYDMNPVSGTVYSLEVVQDSIDTAANGQAVGTLEIYFDTEIANYLQVAAHRRFELCSSSSDGETTAATGPTLGAPANGVLVSDNFQDGNGNAPFNLQVRNTTGNATNWQAAVTGPYATIPNLNAGPYTLETTDNGDGTYTHVFTGTSQLGGFQNVTITGGVPTPAGQGGTANVDLYIP